MNLERLRRAPRIAIVGSSSPVGKELKDLIQERGLSVGDLKLLDTEGYAGLLQEFAGQIAITQIISPTAMADVDIAFFACSPAIMNAYAAGVAAFPGISIDLTQTDRPGVIVLNGISDPGLLDLPNDSAYFINPHPAVIVLARVLSALQRKFAVASASVTILEPASERGAAAIEELQEQTVNLLNFQTAGSKLFKGQIAFNVLPETETAKATEGLIRKQLAVVLGSTVPTPALMTLQASVFHSEGFSMFVRFVDFAAAPAIEEIRGCLADTQGHVLVQEDEDNVASPVGVVGSDKIHVGRISVESGEPWVYGFWMAADNLRIAAAHALGIAEGIMFQR